MASPEAPLLLRVYKAGKNYLPVKTERIFRWTFILFNSHPLQARYPLYNKIQRKKHNEKLAYWLSRVCSISYQKNSAFLREKESDLCTKEGTNDRLAVGLTWLHGQTHCNRWLRKEIKPISSGVHTFCHWCICKYIFDYASLVLLTKLWREKRETVFQLLIVPLFSSSNTNRGCEFLWTSFCSKIYLPIV